MMLIGIIPFLLPNNLDFFERNELIFGCIEENHYLCNENKNAI